MKLLLFFVTVLGLGRGRILSTGCCGDDFSGLAFAEERTEDCADGICSLFAEKRTPEKVVQSRQLLSRVIGSEDSLVQWRSMCGCVMQSKLVDLGEGHYPRYVTMANCKAKTCSNKFYQCKDYEYRVHILARRGLRSALKETADLDIRDVQELTLPESLHANWQLFSMSVPVTCLAVERS